MGKKKPDKLSQDAAKALAAGMSYGKWKAMQQPVSTENGIPEGWKACPQCGKPFRPTRGKKYCEPYCRSMAYYDRQIEIQRAYDARRRAKKDAKE